MPTTTQTKIIDAPIIDVWNKLKNFHDFSWAPNVVTHVEKIGVASSDSVGAKRVLNKAFHETLVEIDHTAYRLKYSIDDGPSPVSKQEVSNYFGIIQLSVDPGGNGTLVEWDSSWDSDVEDAVSFCSSIYTALLGELARSFQDH